MSFFLQNLVLISIISFLPGCKSSKSPALEEQFSKAGPHIKKLIEAHYIGWLIKKENLQLHKGKMTYNSYDQTKPLPFILDTETAIKGWGRGIARMQVGEKRSLITPSALAYSHHGADNNTVPPNNPLIFEIKLMNIL